MDPKSSDIQPDKESYSEVIQKNEPMDSEHRLGEFSILENLKRMTSKKKCISVLNKLEFARFSAISEFGKLVIYVSKQPEPAKTQLACLLFPTFVHLYILLLQISKHKSHDLAQKLFSTYACIFYKGEGYENILEELKSLKDISDVHHHPYFKNFREQKCIFGLSVDVLKDLASFIDEMNSSALLYVFHFHFHFEDESILNHNLPDDCLAHLKEDSAECSEEITEKDNTIISSNSIQNHIPDDCYSIEVSTDSVVSADENDESQSETLSTLSEILENGYRNLIPEINFHCIKLCCGNDVKFSLDFDINKSELWVAFNKKLYLKKLKDMKNHSLTEILNVVEHRNLYKFNDELSVVKYIPHTSDELLIAVGKTVVRYSLTLNKEILIYETAHTAEIFDMDVDSSATYFVTVSEDATACIFYLNSKEAIRKYIGHLGRINCVRFHPIGDYFMTGSSDCSVRLWTVEKDLTLRCFNGHTDEIFSIACANNGKILASADAAGVVRLWDLETSCVLSELFCDDSNGPIRGKVTSLCFDDTSSSLIACYITGMVKMWNVKKPDIQNSKNFTDLPLLVKYDTKYKVWVLLMKKAACLQNQGEIVSVAVMSN